VEGSEFGRLVITKWEKVNEKVSGLSLSASEVGILSVVHFVMMENSTSTLEVQIERELLNTPVSGLVDASSTASL
jgi:hypothetical protein